MMSLSGDGDGTYAETGRWMVLAMGFVLCLIGAGGLVMADMGSRGSTQGRYTSSAVIEAATGVERKVALPAPVSGAILTLGLSVTLVVATRRPSSAA